VCVCVCVCWVVVVPVTWRDQALGVDAELCISQCNYFKLGNKRDVKGILEKWFAFLRKSEPEFFSALLGIKVLTLSYRIMITWVPRLKLLSRCAYSM